MGAFDGWECSPEHAIHVFTHAQPPFTCVQLYAALRSQLYAALSASQDRARNAEGALEQANAELLGLSFREKLAKRLSQTYPVR